MIVAALFLLAVATGAWCYAGHRERRLRRIECERYGVMWGPRWNVNGRFTVNPSEYAATRRDWFMEQDAMDDLS